ncbi:hypothetical protein GTR02_07130, partial [Kineococcus sp. R8]|uniref:DICT sensory domain-containing protein n=1 Tax=Kineococcus siccus TaxID=2696567 RepID=UPI00196AB338
PVRVSPFQVAVAGGPRPTSTRTKRDLLALSRRCERRAGTGGDDLLVLVTVQENRFWTARTRAVYARIAARGATVVAFGVGLPTDLRGPGRGGVATVGIAEDDLLADEWLVVFCSPTERWGFLARDAAAGLPGARSGPRLAPPDDPGTADADRRFLWADLDDPVWLERSAAVLLTRVPSLAVRVPWLQR